MVLKPLDDLPSCSSAVKLANEKVSVPITCKIRVFNEVDRTVKYAQMLEKAGCQVRRTGGGARGVRGLSG